MERKRILIAEATTEFCEQLSNHLAGEYDLCICHDGVCTKEQLECFCPDLVVMDLSLPGLDGISILEYIAGLYHRPRLLLISCYTSPYMENMVRAHGADFVLLKPCNMESMTDRIGELLHMEAKPVVQLPITDSSLSGSLMNLNIPPKRKGFDYLKYAIERYMEDPHQSVTKSLYPQVAKAFNTNPTAVERAMRQAIHESWERRNEQMWRRYFQADRAGMVPRPTNAEFIAQMAQWHQQGLLEQIG